MSLSKEQIALLENLTYFEKDAGANVRNISDYEGRTIGDWLSASEVYTTDNPHAMMTGKEWTDIINAVKNDPTLMNMKIVDTHVDNTPTGGGGKSVVFVSESEKEAVVAFKGTQSGKEWNDNFHGADTVDTPQQQNALNWYKETYSENNLDQYSVTVTGHSKGGNKAKYITIMDDTVDRCYSFDGQGFSDEFFDTYHDQIAANQDKITNINAEDDFVNILLNDVGKREYYEGYNIGDGGFAENHCPNAILKFDEDGNFTMVQTEQSPEMQALDEFLNSYIRSIPPDERGDMIDLLGKIMTEKGSLGDMDANELANYFANLATDPKYSDDLAYLLAYTVKYSQEHPEVMDDIKGALEKCGLGDYVQYVDTVQDVLNFEMDTWFGTIRFQDILGFLADMGGKIPNWLMKILLDELRKKTGISFTPKQIYDLLALCSMTAGYMNTVNVSNSGADLQIHSHSSGGGAGAANLMIYLKALFSFIENMIDQVSKVSLAGDELDSVLKEGVSEDLGDINGMLKKIITRLREDEKTMRSMHTALDEITKLYERTEKEIASSGF